MTSAAPWRIIRPDSSMEQQTEVKNACDKRSRVAGSEGQLSQERAGIANVQRGGIQIAGVPKGHHASLAQAPDSPVLVSVFMKLSKPLSWCAAFETSRSVLRIRGHDSDAVLQGMYWLEDRMEQRGGPFLSAGRGTPRSGPPG